MFLPRCMATGIGSLPFKDPDDAVDLVLDEFPVCPHWPQLPQRDRREHFVHQFLHPLVTCGLLVCPDGGWLFDLSRDSCADSLTAFYSSCLACEDGNTADLESFLPPRESAAGFYAFLERAGTDDRLKNAAFLKGQIAGPLSVALELKDEQGRPAYYREELRDMIVRNLSLNARAQARALSSLGRPAIVFVDDPGIGAYGSWSHLALSREAIQEDLNAIFAAIRSEGALSGVHSCEAVDWSLLTESDADIISVDSYRFGASLIPYAEPLRGFLKGGGAVAWGCVPTLDDPFAESAESLLRGLFGLWEELFPARVDREGVLGRSMITPACGTGLLPEAQARRIYRLTAEVSRDLGGRHDST